MDPNDQQQGMVADQTQQVPADNSQTMGTVTDQPAQPVQEPSFQVPSAPASPVTPQQEVAASAPSVQEPTQVMETPTETVNSQTSQTQEVAEQVNPVDPASQYPNASMGGSASDQNTGGENNPPQAA